MGGPLMGVGQDCCEAPYSPPPLSKRLADRKAKLEAELVKVDKAITLMMNTPELSELMDTISQLNV